MNRRTDRYIQYILRIIDLVCSVSARQRCDFPIQVILIWMDSDTCLNKNCEMVDQTPNFSDPKSCEILRSNSCDLARPVAICSQALRTEATGRWRLGLIGATWRWSRRCWPRAPPSRRRMATVRAPRGGWMWQDGRCGKVDATVTCERHATPH